MERESQPFLPRDRQENFSREFQSTHPPLHPSLHPAALDGFALTPAENTFDSRLFLKGVDFCPTGSYLSSSFTPRPAASIFA
jgi:hypothetical protein